MPIITIILVLVIVGVFLWIINTFIPMAGSIKAILNIFVVVCVVWWILSMFGLVSSFGNLQLK